jgi:hypothetical protein
MNNENLKSNKEPKMKTSVCIAAKGGIVPEAPLSDPGFNTEGKRSAHQRRDQLGPVQYTTL